MGEQDGSPCVVKNGGLLAAPFVGLSVSSGGERGLLGIALDPDFASNRYVYRYDTVPTGTVHNRTSRFTANGDVALAGLKAMHQDLFQLTAQQQLFCFSPRLP